MSIQRVTSRPSFLQQQCAAGQRFDGTLPTSDAPLFDANGVLVWPEETAGDAGGVFDFQTRRLVLVSEVRINVPSGDVAGFNLYVNDGAVDTEVAASTDTETSYVASGPFFVGRGETLKITVPGPSAGLIRVTVVACVIGGLAEVKYSIEAPPAGGPVVEVNSFDVDAADAVASPPAGLTWADRESALTSAATSNGWVRVILGTNPTAEYFAPIADSVKLGKVVARGTAEETVTVMGRVRKVSGGATNAEIGLIISQNVADPNVYNSHAGIRIGLGTLIHYQGTTYSGAGPTFGTGLETTGCWLKAVVGATGGIRWFYSLDTTDDWSAVSWTAFPTVASWETTGWVVDSARLAPGASFKAELYAADANASPTLVAEFGELVIIHGDALP